MRIVISVLCLLLSFASAAHGRVLAVDGVKGQQSLMPYFTWLADPQGRYSIEDVTSPEMQGRFAPLPNGFPVRTSGPVWLRLMLITSKPGGAEQPLVMNLGDLPAGTTKFYKYLTPERMAEETLVSQEAVTLPAPGLTPANVYVRMEETPGLWFAATVTPRDEVSLPMLPPDLLLPGLILLALVLCLLRAVREKAAWPLWASLFLVCVLIESLLPLPGVHKGFSFGALPALLAPGIALLVLPHVGRCMFRAGTSHPALDRILAFYSLTGVLACLVPLLPGMGWLSRLFPIWPLLLIPLLPLCLRALASRLPGSLAFTGACILPAFGAVVALWAISSPGLHPLAPRAALWGLAVGGLGFALARVPRTVPEEAGDDARADDDLDSLAGLSLGLISAEEEKARSGSGEMPLSSKGQYAELPPLDVFTVRPRELPVEPAVPELAPERLAAPEPAADPPGADGGTEAAEASGAASSFLDAGLALYASRTGAEPVASGVVGELALSGEESRPEDAGREPERALFETPAAMEIPPEDDIWPAPLDGAAQGPGEPGPETDGHSMGPLAESFTAGSSARAPEVGPGEPKVISLVDDDLSGYTLDILEELQEGVPRQVSLAVGDGYVFNLQSLVREVHDTVKPLAKAKGLIFSWYIAPSLPVLLEGDAPRLRQALSLLLQNAVQVSSQGTVQLTVKRTPSDPDALESCRPGDACHLHFTVSDNGSAQRTDAGFFHAWDLAARTGGSFAVEYSPVSGTQVIFSAGFTVPSDAAANEHLNELARQPQPAALEPEPVPGPVLEEAQDDLETRLKKEGLVFPEERAEPAPEEADEPAPASGPLIRFSGLPCILVTEMTTSNKRLLAHYLSGFLYEHKESPVLAEVSALVRQSPVSLVIFDADMPETDVVRAMKAVREQERKEGLVSVPILALTSHAAQASRMQAAGADRTLDKPFSQEELESVVLQCVPALVSQKADKERQAGEEGRPSSARAATAAPENAAKTAPAAEEPLDLLAAALHGAAPLSGGQPREVRLPERDRAHFPPAIEFSRPEEALEAVLPGKAAEEPASSVPAPEPAHEERQVPGPGPEQAPAGGEDTAPSSVAPILLSLSTEDVSPQQTEVPLLDLIITEEETSEQDQKDAAAEPEQKPAEAMAPGTEPAAAPQVPIARVSGEGAPSSEGAPLARKDEPTPGPETDAASSAEPDARQAPPKKVRVAAKVKAVAKPVAKAANTPPKPVIQSVDMTAESPQSTGSVARDEGAAPGGERPVPVPAERPTARSVEGAEDPRPWEKEQQTWVQTVPLQGVEGESLELGMLTLVPGLVHSLRDGFEDVRQGLERSQTILIQEAAGRIAGKAEVFGLHKLGKISRCVERAAEADDMEAASTLMEDLGNVVERYIAALQESYNAFLSLDR